MKLMLLILVLTLLPSLTGHAQALNTSLSDTEFEGLVGSIYSVQNETVVLAFDNHGVKETARWVDSVITYNRRGKMTTVTSYGDKKIQRKRIYAYDGNMVLLKETEYEYGKLLHSLTKYVYLAPQRAVVRLFYNPEGELLPNRIISVYDEGGRVVKLVQDDGGGEPLIWILLKLDADGRPVEHIHCSAKNNQLNETAEESSICESGKYAGKVVTKYDKNGNPERETQYNGDGSIFTDLRYEYECDAKGSWVKRFKYNMQAVDGEMNARPSEVTYRVIRYRATQPNKPSEGDRSRDF